MKRVVLFVGHDYRMGGIFVAFLKLAKLLEDNGYDVKVLLPYREDYEITALPRRYIVGYAWRWRIKIPIVRWVLKWFFSVLSWRLYFAFTKKICHDILVIYSAQFDALWKMYSTKPSIGFIHSYVEPRNEQVRSLGYAYYDAIEKARRRIDLIAGVAPNVVSSAMKADKLTEEPLLLPNLFDTSAVIKRGRAYDVPRVEGKLNVVCVSRLTEQKGITRLIWAIRKAIDECGEALHVNVVGGGSQGYVDECISLISKLGLDHTVTLVGAKENPYPYVKSSDLLVLPSKSEGFGLVVWEALALSRPVLVTDCGGTSYATNYGEWGRLVPNTDEDFTKGLISYIKDPRYCSPRCGFDRIISEINRRNSENEKRILEVFNSLGTLPV